MLLLKSLKILLIANKHLSYKPNTTRKKEPLIPGKILNIPTSILLKKLFIVNYIKKCLYNSLIFLIFI